MIIKLQHLTVRTHSALEQIPFSSVITFLHGPVGTGKSTVARLVDYCLGGELERTPAIQQEFISAELSVVLGHHPCLIERSASDTQSVRVTWSSPDSESESVNAPLDAQEDRLIDAEVHNLSDLLFHLCGIVPIKVRKRSRDPDSPLIRLSFRDIWWYCYLEQPHLDSSFFHLGDPFKGRKSQDAMRFFTGLHSERLSQLEGDLVRVIDEQRSKREAVQQIRTFMARFELESEISIEAQVESAKQQLNEVNQRKLELDKTRSSQIHPTDELRGHLRQLGRELQATEIAQAEAQDSLEEQVSLRAELITAKTKAGRASAAGRILDGAEYERCPQCGSDIAGRPHDHRHCRLCGSDKNADPFASLTEMEAFRRDLNERIDQIADSIKRREREIDRMGRQSAVLRQRKFALDRELQEKLDRYDSAFVESIRGAEREIATLTERLRSLQKLRQMPKAIADLEEEAGELQGKIDRLRSSFLEERGRLRGADENVRAIAQEFKRIMLAVHFPGVSEDDEITLDPRNWEPIVTHGKQVWGFWDTGSGGKKTLFNVCYAMAVHTAAMERGLPVPDVLIVDSPTKNISETENPELVRSLYDEIYRLAARRTGRALQLVLIDSDLVHPPTGIEDFADFRMAGEPDAPSLFSNYVGP